MPTDTSCVYILYWGIPAYKQMFRCALKEELICLAFQNEGYMKMDASIKQGFSCLCCISVASKGKEAKDLSSHNGFFVWV